MGKQKAHIFHVYFQIFLFNNNRENWAWKIYFFKILSLDHMLPYIKI